MLVNRVGDIGLALGISVCFLTFKTLDYATIFALIPCVLGKSLTFLCFDFNAITIISFLIF
jgi:NADH:ubiquinone oxidoreductase subunit 5 (subunit L)/multisubunit Na+/H+ antiporter MnhA subunit